MAEPPRNERRGQILPKFPLRVLAVAVAVAMATAAAAPVVAAPEGSGLPLPRFVSLRAEKARLRTGPGIQYPEEWVYLRKDLPLEVIAEHHTWRKVRDWEGTQGWMHQSLISGRRTIIVMGALRTLRQKPDIASGPAARAEAGVVGLLEACPEASIWCRVEVDGIKGWLRKVEFWGVYPDEVVK